MDEIGMNLPECKQRPRLFPVHCAQVPEESGAIALDGGTRIVLRESQVERVSPVNTRVSAGPGAEAVHQPGDTRQRTGRKDDDLVFPGELDRHLDILAIQPNGMLSADTLAPDLVCARYNSRDLLPGLNVFIKRNF
jgi:hypothetical protein